MVLLHLAGAVAGYGLSLLGVPLAWMIGSMLMSATMTIAFDVARPPAKLRFAAQTAVGGSIGLYLTPEALARILSFGFPIVASAVLITAAACVIGIAQSRLTGLDRATSIFSCVPGGPLEMANLTALNGGDPGRAAFAQTTRILAIILLFPPFLLASGADMTFIGTTLSEADLAGIATMLALAAVGATLAFYARVANPFFLGPMLVVGLAVGAGGLTIPPLPDLLISTAQVLLGVSLGSMFRRDLMRSGLQFLGATATTTLLLLAVCIGLAELWAIWFDVDFATLALANAPGAVTEMAITAKAMRLDVLAGRRVPGGADIPVAPAAAVYLQGDEQDIGA